MNIISEDTKREVAGRARTLQERLETPHETDERLDLDESIDEYVGEWMEYVGGADPETFEERLRRGNVDPDELPRRLLVGGWPADDECPEWVDELDAILTHVLESEAVEVDPDASDEIPFVHVLEPLVDYAEETVDGEATARLTDSAMDGLTDWLLTQLSAVAAHTLFIKFKTFVARHDRELAFENDATDEEASTEYYEQFVNDVLSGDLTDVFVEHAFLSRLVVTVIRQWIDAVEEFGERVSEDWPQLRETFALSGEALEVTNVEALGDRHHDGRTVLGVTFRSGEQVAYKPRNSGIVAGYNSFLEWINANGDLPHLRTLDVLNCDTYSWMEWVKPEECATEDEIADYYERAGMLVCVFYAWSSADMHFENICAVGDQPVGVDMETLAQPNIRPGFRSIDETIKTVLDSVLQTAAIPEYHPSANVNNTAGFAAGELSATVEVKQYTNENTDAMDIEHVEEDAQVGENLPRYDGEITRPRAYSDEIAHGFEEMYRFIAENKSELLGSDGPIARLKDQESRIRVLYRPTRSYSSLLRSMSFHSYHRTGLEFGRKVETLASRLLSDDVNPELWAVYESEQRTLKRVNVPRFTAKIDSTALYNQDRTVIDDFFEKKPITQIRDRIQSFDEADLEEQLTYIRWGYDGPQAIDPGFESTAVPDAATDLPDVEAVAGEHSREIFDRIVANAVTEDGSPDWILREIGPNGGVYVHSLDPGLYNGTIGISLFASGLAYVFGDDRYRDLAETLATRAIEEVHDQRSSLPVGAGSGLGSVVYGLTKVGKLLDDDQYVNAATDLVASIEPEQIIDDARYDVLYGSAGLILSLLPLYDLTGDERVIDRARDAGVYLTESYDEYDGAPVWHSSDYERPLCGFSHGQAGIAYALFRLGTVSGESRFTDVALRSLEYEDRQYSQEMQNWPDLRSTTRSDCMDAWCHGRTGIGLARLSMHELDPRSELRRDVERALRGIDASSLPARDHVCCGTFGRVEVLRQAGRALDDPTYRQAGKRLAAASVARADEHEQFATDWQTEQWYNPCLFSGEAGIGYSLLQFVDPSLPSVLTWE